MAVGFAAAAAPSLPVAATSSRCTDPLVREGSGRDAVYVATVPLRASGGPAQMLASAGYNLGLWDLQHFMVVVKPRSDSASLRQATAFDFQPCDPENIYIALSALSCKRVPGVILKRTLNRMPKKRCWFVGFSNANGVDVADKFNEDWDTDLILGIHDCRHYTNGITSFNLKPKSPCDWLNS